MKFQFFMRRIRGVEFTMLAVLSVGLTGCGGGGGGGVLDKLKSAVGVAASTPAASTPTSSTTSASTSSSTAGGTTTTTGGTTTTTGGTTTTAAAQANSLFISLSDVTKASSAVFTPNTGTQTTLSTGGWTEVAKATAAGTMDPGLPDDAAGAAPGTKFYKRPISVAATAAGSVPGSSGTLTQWVSAYFQQPGGTFCPPTTSTCGYRSAGTLDVASLVSAKDSAGNAITLSGDPNNLTKADVLPALQAGANIVVRMKKMEVDSFVSANAQLQHANVGTYSDVELQGTLTLAGVTNGDGIDPATATGKVSDGFFHTGTRTSASDMSTLQNGGVQASYAGFFFGRVGVGTATTNDTSIFGDASLTAKFGSGDVTGNITKIQTRTGTDTATGSAINSPVPYDLGLTGKISPGTPDYKGTVGFVPAAGATTMGSVTDSTLLGTFYGPQAAETGGVLRVQGTTPSAAGAPAGTTGTTVIQGAFGAKKVP